MTSRQLITVVAMGACLWGSRALADVPPGDIPIPDPIPGAKQVYLDEPDDLAIRRTDMDGQGTLIPGGTLPELLYSVLGRWEPVDALIDPYFGNFTTNGGFLRLDLVYDGLLNPPGPTTSPYDPDRYGPSPLYTFVELDLDANRDTGGEVYSPESTYNGVVARFGGVPQEARFADRILLDGSTWNGTYAATPAYHRSGHDMFVFLNGEEFINIAGYVEIQGDGDGKFETGETWELDGGFIFSASSYDYLTYALYYIPPSVLRFKHVVGDDRTVVTLVYPLTNAAYAELTGESEEPWDFSPENANSVHEFLENLNYAVQHPLPGATSDEFWPMMTQWGTQNPLDYLDPTAWRFSSICGSALNEYGSGLVDVSTDVWPNVIAGDFNGDGLITKTDRQMLVNYVGAADGTSQDADGLVNGQVELVEFALRFRVFDHDYDGFATTAGFPIQAVGDYDNDGDVDLRDFQSFQHCYSNTALDPGVLANVGCLDAFDDDDDLDIDLLDLGVFSAVLDGPAGGAGR